MIIPSTNPAISIAGTSHAASKGATADDAAIHGNQQAESAAKGNDKTNATLETEGSQDRGGDGRQVLDVFERREKRHPPQEEMGEESTEDETDSKPKQSAPLKRLDIIV